MRQETPEPWADAMRAAGAIAPNGAPSINRLATMAGLSVEATRRLLYGMGSPLVSTVNAVAAALRIDVRDVSRWVNQARSVVEPYRPPADADLLTLKERRALDALIRAIADTRRANDASQEPGTQTGGTPQQPEAAIAAADVDEAFRPVDDWLANDPTAAGSQHDAATDAMSDGDDTSTDGNHGDARKKRRA